jgi:hypothetical protein
MTIFSEETGTPVRALPALIRTAVRRAVYFIEPFSPGRSKTSAHEHLKPLVPILVMPRMLMTPMLIVVVFPFPSPPRMIAVPPLVMIVVVMPPHVVNRHVHFHSNSRPIRVRVTAGVEKRQQTEQKGKNAKRKSLHGFLL